MHCERGRKRKTILRLGLRRGKLVGQPRRKETNAQLKAADAENLVLTKFQMWLKHDLAANVSCLINLTNGKTGMTDL